MYFTNLLPENVGSLTSALLEVDHQPRNEWWPHPISPWDFTKNSNHFKSITPKRKSVTIENKKKTTSKEKRGTFSFYDDIKRYIREYRKVRNILNAKYQNCTCHECCDKEDVRKVYETLEKAKKRYTVIQEKKPDEHRSPRRRKQTKALKFNKMNFTKYMLPQSNFEAVDQADEMNHFEHLAEQYIEDSKHFEKHQHCDSFPVIKLTIPDDHFIPRVETTPSLCRSNTRQNYSSCSSVGLTTTVNECPSSSHSSKRTSPTKNWLGEYKSDRSVDSSNCFRLAHSNSPEKMYRTVSDRSWDVNQLKEDFGKQTIPWKTLQYLGYKPSMRQYLHEIYTPIRKRQSVSPLVLSGAQRMSTENIHQLEKITKTVANRNKNLTSFVEKNLGKDDSQIIELNFAEEKPKLAIISSYHTVVKAKVTTKTVNIK